MSPLAETAQWVFPLHAGTEGSIAATKSVIAQMTAGARLVAAWQNDIDLQTALSNLPQVLSRAVTGDWSAALPVLKDADRLLVIARGLGLPVALEAALKFKEVCGIQAEAFSGAELQHGPMALIGKGYPVLVLAPRGPAQAGLLALADDLACAWRARVAGRARRDAAHQPADHRHRRNRAGPDLGAAEFLPDGGKAVARARLRP